MASRKFAVLLLLSVMLICTPFRASAFDPDDLTQWQDAKFRFLIRERLYLYNDRPAQFNKDEDSGSTRSARDLKVQFRLFENPDWGRIDMFTGITLSTIMDVPDRLDHTYELSWRVWKKIRLEFGHFREQNIGIINPDRGRKYTWIGTGYRLMDSDDLSWDIHGRYYLDTNASARISNQLYDTPALGLKNQLTAEIGSSFHLRLNDYFSVILAPSILFNKNIGVSSLKTAATLQYEIWKHINFLPKGINLQLGSSLGLDRKQTQKDIWIGIGWEFRF